jgi:cation diffusion facilitator family transporter
MSVESKTNAQVMTRVTVIGAVVDGLLGLLKIGVGFVSQSHALVADGVHSLSDLGTDVLVILAAKWSNEEPDANHPYGHDRIETLATLILGSVLLAVAGGIFYDSLQRFFDPSVAIELGIAAFAITVASIVSKEAIYRYTRHYAQLLNSKLLMANAWHSRTDALSSIAVLVGLIGVSFDLIWLDALAALIVAVFIAKIALTLLWDAMQELIDTALPEDQVTAIRAVALDVPGLRDVHHIRTRTMAGKTLMDLHLQVDPRVSVSEGHEIGCWVAASIRAQFQEITDITFHIDPEDDAEMDQEGPTSLRPLRREVLECLRADWGPLVDDAQIRLHYLRGVVDVEVVTHQAVTADALKSKSRAVWLGRVTVLHPTVGDN